MPTIFMTEAAIQRLLAGDPIEFRTPLGEPVRIRRDPPPSHRPTGYCPICHRKCKLDHTGLMAYHVNWELSGGPHCIDCIGCIGTGLAPSDPPMASTRCASICAMGARRRCVLGVGHGDAHEAKDGRMVWNDAGAAPEMPVEAPGLVLPGKSPTGP